MKIDTASLDQLRSFNDFARLQGANSKAIARPPAPPAPDNADKLTKLKDVASGSFGPFAKLTFNPEYKA